ncbi:predicted protein [Uncinocarpus reesii 1704]|uniref:Sacsin/Nov domain-containing protein n=1 Tax=Uncinocarpus reesii (strain UAMH 1704) TaxID=336963 RepID=C4JSR9_UNCRE|nr:uncharacterized protein UREG_05508 [Uncinocarpus reesii 1704]EEP80666.1 predicted protein [Uncinocarpus reesii 1704]
MAQLSKEEARAIIDNIREQNGGITQSDREQTPQSVLRVLNNLQRKLGAAIKILASNLYSTDARFVFELIQNAEDASYRVIQACNELPFIKFTVCHDRVIIDSNEDGFSVQDVRAICSTGESTKTNIQGYIGEKGIGFKSVFKVASKVHIQSGPFSFYFEHNRGEDGLGMVTPISEEPMDLPVDVRTRITLILSDPSKFNTCMKEIQDIPETLTLFLSKLKIISLSIQPLNEDPWEVSYSCAYDTSSSSMTLTRTTNNSSRQTFYRVVKRILSPLPRDPARKGRHRAEVVLAFPVSDHSAELKPVLQSDFITQASREDIHHSPWNDAILDGVADTFRDAVIQFCDHPSLRYLWLDYIPQNVSDPFWAQLRDKIIDRMKTARVFLTWKERLDCAEHLRQVPLDCLDQHSQPLFEDMEPEIYLSRGYQKSSNFGDIASMGIRAIDWVPEIFRLVQPYVGPATRKILDQDDSWHTRFSKLFLNGLGNPSVAPRIKRLDLIPLASGRLGSTASADIFFPTDSCGIPIPRDLPLRLVDPSSLTNFERRMLFKRLGVTHCSPQRVIRLITAKYNILFCVGLDQSIVHLRYLYKTLSPDDTLNDRVFLMDQNFLPIYRSQIAPHITFDDLYFEDDNAYGMKQLSRAFQSTTGPVIHFLHSSYLNAGLSDIPNNGRSWEEWLVSAAGVRWVPRLRARSTMDCLSEVFESIVREHPDKLLGVLRTYWLRYNESDKSSVVICQLSNAEIPCRNAQSKPLRLTYLPLTELENKCADLDIKDDMPFVRLPSEWPSEDIDGWRFLEEFGVGREANLPFFLDALRCVIEKIRQGGFTMQRKSSLFEIYESIFDWCRGEDDFDAIRDVFKGLEAVYVPSSESHDECLSPPEDCVWSGPSFLRVRSALGFYDTYRESGKIKKLLTGILKIPNAGRAVYLKELAWMRNRSISFDNLLIVYRSLLEVARPNNWEQVRSAFKACSLVYIRSQNLWCKPSSCLWTVAPRVGNQFGIASDYGELEELFVSRLLVQAPTIATYIEQLKTVSTGGSPNRQDIQSAILSITELGPTSRDVDGLRHVKFLPVKLSRDKTVYENPAAEFFIVDRIEYGSAFDGKVPVLDLSLEDVRQFRGFLLALGFADRYMSAAVKESTTVLQPAVNPTAILTHEIRMKAKALFRCAVHFNSTKTLNRKEAVCRMLQGVQIYESQGFSKTLNLTLGGLAITAESARGLLHLEDEGDVLKIYVPRDQKDRRRCYANQLPKELMNHLGIADPAARGVFQNIIRSEMDILDDILEEDGIIQVDMDLSHDGDVDSLAEDEAASDVVTRNLSSGHAGPRPEALATTPESYGSEGGSDLEPPTVEHEYRQSLASLPQDNARRHTGSSRLFPHPNRVGNNESPVPEELQDRSAYTNLLIQVSTAARQANFEIGTLDEAFTSRAPISPALSATPFGNRRLNQLDHDTRIGAAGELFVFELLSRLNLPGFGRQNWRSSIRKEVRSHPDYHDLEPWNGVETADFVYNDSEGALTRLLVSQDLAAPSWGSARPRYLIEVKSTVSTFNTPFYMSKSQFRRIHATPPLSEQSPNEVYLVFRVYHLGTGHERFWIYNGATGLEFTPETYSVVHEPIRLN